MIVQSFQNSTSRKSCLFSIDVASMFRRFCVDISSILCRCLLGYMSILGPYSVRILLLFLRIITGISTSRLCASGVVHFLNVALIVSWLNVIVCNWTYTVIYKSMLISKLDLEKCLSFFCRFAEVFPRFSNNFSSIFCGCLLGFLSIFRLFSVDACLVFFSCSVRILFIFCSYYRARAQEPAQARFVPPDSSHTSGPTSCIVPLVKRPIHCIMTKYNRL